MTATTTRAKPHPPPAGSDEDVTSNERTLEDGLRIARQAAHEAWPVEILDDAKPVRIAAATALVEFGFDADEVRRALNLQGTIIGARDALTPAAQQAASAALTALETP